MLTYLSNFMIGLRYPYFKIWCIGIQGTCSCSPTRYEDMKIFTKLPLLPNENWYKYATDSLQGCITLSEGNITTAKNWLAYIAVQAEKDAITYASGCDLPKVKPLLVNHKQTLIVYYNLKELLQIAKGCAEITSVRKRLLVQGIADPGKSQVIQIITRLCRRIFKSNRAVLNVAPTSAAAVLLPDGRTVHSVTPPPMKKKMNCTMSLVDYPLNAHAMNRMKTLALGADNKFALMCINADERGMMGQALIFKLFTQ